MKYLHIFVFLLISALSVAESNAQIRDTLIYLTNGLAYDKRPNLDQYKGVKMAGSHLLASQRYKFVQMFPASPNSYNDTILYLLPDDYRGELFDAPSLNSRSQKAAVFLLDCESNAIRIQESRRRLIPPRGCSFVRWKEGMTFKGKTVIVIPKL